MVLIVSNNSTQSSSLPTTVAEVLSSSPIRRANELFLAQEERDISSSALVYVAQGEAMIASSPCVDFIGSADATTCLIFIASINQTSASSRSSSCSRCSLCAHLDSDSPIQMESLQKKLNRLQQLNEAAVIDVFLCGSYDQGGETQQSTSATKDWSLISSSVIKLLTNLPFELNLRLFCVGLSNTMHQPIDAPRITSLFLDLRTNDAIARAFFPLSCRGPWLAARSLLVLKLSPKLSDCVYNSKMDRFRLHRFPFPRLDRRFVLWMQSATDDLILKHMSTSPLVEPSHFCADLRERYSLQDRWWIEREPGANFTRDRTEFVRQNRSNQWRAMEVGESE